MPKARAYASASIIRSDSLDCPAGATTHHRGEDRPIARVTLRMCQGAASHGYATNYQRVETFWMEGDTFGPDGKLVTHKGWTFSGRNAAERAAKAYRIAVETLAKQYPGASATFPTL